MTLVISSFPDGGEIPVRFSQAADGSAPGRGTSPAIAWTNTPIGTQSLVLSMRDIDMPNTRKTDDQTVHWIVWNIPPSVMSLPQGALPGSPRLDGSHQISASGAMYRGPGTPENGPRHHYLFELFALDTRLDIQQTTDALKARAEVLSASQGHILGKAVYVGLFRRPQ